jgi:Phage integrase, N-terminal SAM-like domain
MRRTTKGQVDGWKKRNEAPGLGLAAAALVWQLAGKLYRARPGTPLPTHHLYHQDGRRVLPASERRLIEHDEWTSPKSRAAQRNAQGMTLFEYAAKWIEQRNVKPSTAIEYRRTKKRLIDPTIGKLPLRAVTADAVRGWHTSLGTSTPRANSHAYGLLHAIVKTAVTDGLLTTNPCSIQRAMSAPTQRQAAILTTDEPKPRARRSAPRTAQLVYSVLAFWHGRFKAAGAGGCDPFSAY